MQTITKYRADDGTEFNSPEAAAKHEQLSRRCEDALSSLGPRRDIPMGSWIQHTESAFVVAQAKLYEILCEAFPDLKAKRPSDCHPQGGIGRRFDGGGPLAHAWGRFSRINSMNFREYDQMFYALNPGEAEGGPV